MLRHIRALALAGGLLLASSTAQAQPAPNVTMDMYMFMPAEITVSAGTTVTWTNTQTDDQHTTTSNDGLWDSGNLDTGQSFQFTFQQPGDFAYTCSLHSDMQGIVHVTG